MSAQHYEDCLETTVTVATEHVRQNKLESALGVIATAATHVESPIGGDFADTAYWRTGAALLDDPEVPLDGALKLFDCIVPSVDLGNGLAYLGMDMAKDRYAAESVVRGQRILRYAASIFDKAYSRFETDGTPLAQRYDVLLFDFIRVVGLLDDAGDKLGMVEVANMAAPHLLALARERANLDDLGQDQIDDELAKLATVVGLHSDQGQSLLRSVHNKKYSEAAVHIAIKDFAANLLAAGQLKTALALLKLENAIEPGGSFWWQLNEFIKGQEHALAEAAVEEAVLIFPEMHTSATSYMTLSPIVAVLTELNKDNYLADFFNALIAEGTDITPLIHFAYQCGDFNRRELFQSVISRLELTNARKHAVWQDYYRARNANDCSVR